MKNKKTKFWKREKIKRKKQSENFPNSKTKK